MSADCTNRIDQWHEFGFEDRFITTQKEFELMKKIGCYNWGFVAGKYQTYEPHNCIWDDLKADHGSYADFDFTKWFHDLYRPSHNPYNPKEIELIKRFCALADKESQK